MFACIRDFRRLRPRHQVIFGDHPDARTARFLVEATVRNNWPSQWHTKYSGGYVRFENENGQIIFDLANQTVNGKPVYLFLSNNLTNSFWRKQIAKDQIADWTRRADDKDVFALAQLVDSLTNWKRFYPIRPFAEQLIRDGVEVLGVIQLEELAALVSTSTNLADSDLPRKAA